MARRVVGVVNGPSDAVAGIGQDGAAAAAREGVGLIRLPAGGHFVCASYPLEASHAAACAIA